MISHQRQSMQQMHLTLCKSASIPNPSSIMALRTLWSNDSDGFSCCAKHVQIWPIVSIHCPVACTAVDARQLLLILYNLW